MIDADKLLSRVLSSGAAGGFAAGLLGGGALGMLGSSKKGRKMAKTVLKYGGVAAVGALAYHAYTKYKAGQPGAQPAAATASPEALPPPESRFLPPAADRDAVQSLGVTLIRAMIASARADGEIDAIEGQRVFEQMGRADLDGEEREFLMQELSRPPDLEVLVRAAKTPEIASEIYAASLMAIEVSNPAESAYLQLLASRLKLDPALVAELQRAVAEQSAAAAGEPG